MEARKSSSSQPNKWNPTDVTILIIPPIFLLQYLSQIYLYPYFFYFSLTNYMQACSHIFILILTSSGKLIKYFSFF